MERKRIFLTPRAQYELIQDGSQYLLRRTSGSINEIGNFVASEDGVEKALSLPADQALVDGTATEEEYAAKFGG